MNGRNAPRDRGRKSAITQKRLAAGLTQGQLAEAVGCTQKDVSRWENGVYTPRPDVLMRIARALGCTMEDLINDSRE